MRVVVWFDPLSRNFPATIVAALGAIKIFHRFGKVQVIGVLSLCMAEPVIEENEAGSFCTNFEVALLGYDAPETQLHFLVCKLQVSKLEGA